MKQFKILYKDGNARVGQLSTPHERFKLNMRDSSSIGSRLKECKRTGANVIHPPGGSVSAPLLYGVIHGGIHKDLRVRSAKFTDENFDAIAIGGIYGDKRKLCQIIEWVTAEVSEDKPRHLLGIGEVEDLFNGIERGIDFFDCSAPTRRARFGSLYISPKNGGKKENSFTINIRQSQFFADRKPVDPGCSCYTCLNFSRAYLRHLGVSDEILYHQLATYHNIYFINNLVKAIRLSISQGRFRELKAKYEI